MPASNLVGAGLLIALLTGAEAQQEQRFVLLPPSAATSVAELYPRKGPDRIDGSWQPKLAQIKALEAHLQDISKLRSYDAPDGAQIDHPDRYFRQYVAVVRAGEPVIYVNALCDVYDRPQWRQKFIPISDGGNCFWQAWYDPATATFSELAVNGRA